MSRRVKPFADWYDSQRLITALEAQTDGMIGNRYKDVEFVLEDEEYSVCFNLPTRVSTPPNKTFGLVLEPVEIMDAHFGAWRSFNWVGNWFSFADLGIMPVRYGLGFFSAPLDCDFRRQDRFKAAFIASNKTITPFHHKRREVMEKCISLGFEIDFYGRGLPVSRTDNRVKGEISALGKPDVLLDHHIVFDFENSPTGAITDKLFDPAVCGCIPVTNNAFALQSVGVEKGYLSIDFTGSVDHICGQIRDILSLSSDEIESLKSNYELRSEVTSGKLCLAEWINEVTR